MNKKIKKQFPLVGGASAYVDMQTGKGTIVVPDISDDQMGVQISHVINGGDENLCCGDGARLNLHETLVKEENGYVYTDEIGEKHNVTEQFYYVKENGEKQIITDKSSITVEANGKMTYLDKPYIVYRQEKTDNGLKVTTTLEGIKNVEYYEQRVDEQKQLEERIKAYENAILDFAVASDKGAIKTNCISVDEVINEVKQKNHNEYCLTKSEINHLKNLVMQLNALDCYCDENNKITSKQIELQKKELEEQKNNYLRDELDGMRRAELRNSFYEYQSALTRRKTAKSNYVVSEDNGVMHLQDDCKNPDTANFRYTMTVADVIQIPSIANLYKEEHQQDYRKKYYQDISERCKNEYSNIDKINIHSLYLNKINDYVLVDSDGEIIASLNWEDENCLDEEQLIDFAGTTNIENDIEKPRLYLLSKSEALQVRLLTEQIEYLDEQSINIIYQYNVLLNQINEILSKSEVNEFNLKAYYTEYNLAKSKLDTLKLQIPICFISNGNSVKGFNVEGNLAVIYSENGNYLAIEYEHYYQNRKTKNRISRLYDEKEREIKFVYDKATDMLTEIVNSKGERVRFEYESTFLKTVTYGNNKKVILSKIPFDTHIQYKVVYGNEYVIMDCSKDQVDSISLYSYINSVSHNVIDVGNKSNLVERYTLTYPQNDNISVFDQTQSGNTYAFNGGKCIEETEIKNDVMQSRTTYAYDEDNITKIEQFRRPNLYEENNSITPIKEYSKTLSYDTFDRLISETVDWK